jgi:endogenous inhibitor of DNA gyrase (YacG/DUF329 family)
MAAQTRSVPCPTCGKAAEWSAANPHRPFCSERCKTIDLGAWAAERYRVPVVEDKDEPDSDDLPGSGRDSRAR